MSNDSVAITNLLYRYAEYMDNGDFAGAAELFKHAKIKMRAGDGQFTYLDSASLLGTWETAVKRYDDGTPRTKHVMTNAIVEFAADGKAATARSYYTVFQQTDDLPLQAIITGRYKDEFSNVDGEWRWIERDYSLVDQIGDISHHLNIEVPT